MAPSTPPPPSSDELAALTIAPTCCVVMSPTSTRTRPFRKLDSGASDLSISTEVSNASQEPVWGERTHLRRVDRLSMIEHRCPDSIAKEMLEWWDHAKYISTSRSAWR